MLVRIPDIRVNSFKLKEYVETMNLQRNLENLANPANKAEIGSKETSEATDIKIDENTENNAKGTIKKVQKSITTNDDSEDEPNEKQ
jgi:hypothetical protein